MGSSIPLLLKLCKSMIRSLVDYVVSALVNVGKTNTRKLEAIQNTATSIILRCPKTVNNKARRNELGLQPLQLRMQEMATMQLMRSTATPDNGLLLGRL